MILVQNQVAFIGTIEIVINDEERSTNSAGIRENLELSISNISNQGDFMRNQVGSSQVLDSLDKMSRVSVNTNPNTVNEHFGSIGRSQRLVFLEDFHVSLDHKLNDRIAGSTNGNIAHESQILNETASLSFGSLSRTNQAPVSVV
jgi:hypothetical protein